MPDPDPDPQPPEAVPGHVGQGAGVRWSRWVALAGVGLAVTAALVVGAREVVVGADRALSDGAAALPVGFLGPLGLAGGVSWAALVVVASLVGYRRCRVLALAGPAAVVLTWGAATVVHLVVARPRPSGPGELASFPSGTVALVTVAALLVPPLVALAAVERRWGRWSARGAGVVVILVALHQVHDQRHWPTDVVGGLALGALVGLAARAVMDRPGWHGGCTGCPWHRPGPAGVDRAVGPVPVGAAVARWSVRAGAALALALAVVVAATADRSLPAHTGYRDLGSIPDSPTRLALAAVLAVGAGLALARPGTGWVVVTLAAAALGLFVWVASTPTLVVLVLVVGAAAAGLIWLGWQRRVATGRVAALATVTGTLLVALLGAGVEGYRLLYGPTHPDSTAAPLDSVAGWLWLGGVGADRATVVAGGLTPGQRYGLAHWSEGARVGTVEVDADRYGLARFHLVDLEPATSYAYAVTSDGLAAGRAAPPDHADARFRTFADGPMDQVVVLGSCARLGSNGAVFDAMVAEEPDLFLELGDLHYANLASPDPAVHVAYYGLTAREPGQSALLRSVPTAYVWDDHDYGPNNADASSPSRPGVSVAYRAAIPHYGVDADPEAAIHQAFTVGRVRYLVTDTRSRRDGTSMLGAEQLDWFLDELVDSAADHALVIWANPDPWISAGGPGADDWSAHPDERRLIADAIAEHEIDNLVMVSGDAHMVALDDGTNSDYSTDGGAGFPVLHAAAFDRPGSVKGGPYSEGTFPGSGRYGRLVVHDDGGEVVTVELSGRTWDGEELVAMTLEFAVDPQL